VSDVDHFLLTGDGEDALNDCRLVVVDKVVEGVLPVARTGVILVTGETVPPVIAHPYIPSLSRKDVWQTLPLFHMQEPTDGAVQQSVHHQDGKRLLPLSPFLAHPPQGDFCAIISGEAMLFEGKSIMRYDMV
jgi:hypothetical protein